MWVFTLLNLFTKTGAELQELASGTGTTMLSQSGKFDYPVCCCPAIVQHLPDTNILSFVLVLVQIEET